MDIIIRVIKIILTPLFLGAVLCYELNLDNVIAMPVFVLNGLFIGTYGLIFILYSLKKQLSIVKILYGHSYHKTVAKIIAIKNDKSFSSLPTCTLSYMVNTSKYTVEACSVSKPFVGEEVEILYDTTTPENATLNTFFDLYLFNILRTIAGALLILLSTVFFSLV